MIFKRSGLIIVLAIIGSWLTGCDQGDPTSLTQQVIVEENDIQSIQLSSQNQNNVITTGDSLQLIAEGLDSNSNTLDVSSDVSWSSSDSALATVDSHGLVTSHSDGTVTITATLVSFTATFDITLSSAALLSIEVTATSGLNVSVCRSLQLIAEGTYDDGGAARVITDLVNWSTTTSSASFSSATAGLLNNTAASDVEISASLGSIDTTATVAVNNDILSLSISPLSASISTGQSQSYTALADYLSESDVDISANASWQSSDSTIASFSGAVATTSNPGSVTITGSCSTASDSTSLSVTGLAITKLDFGLSPPYRLMTVGNTYQLTVTGTYSDASTADFTDSVSWTVVNLTGVSGTPVTLNTTQNPIGLIQANSPGMASIEAEINGVSTYLVVEVN